MILRRVIRYLLTLYIWGFVIYQVLPVKVVHYINYAPREFHPKPVLYKYTYAYDVKTAFSNHVGSIKNLIQAMNRNGFDIAFGDFPQSIVDRLVPTPKGSNCYVIRSSQARLFEKILHLLFESLPKSIVMRRSEDMLMRIFPETTGECYLVAHDDRILISTFFGLEIPSYDSILGNRKNIHFSRDVLIRKTYSEEFLKRTVVIFGNNKVTVFAYSDRSFYLPGEKTSYNFKYVVDTDIKNPLIFLFRDGNLKGTFSQSRINVDVSEKGLYTSIIATYKFKINIFYFGFRTVALVSAIGLM